MSQELQEVMMAMISNAQVLLRQTAVGPKPPNIAPGPPIPNPGMPVGPVGGNTGLGIGPNMAPNNLQTMGPGSSQVGFIQIYVCSKCYDP